MNWLIYLGITVEVLQLAVILVLAAKYRRLQRRLDEDLRFTRRPPASITEEGCYPHTDLRARGTADDNSRFEAVRRA